MICNNERNLKGLRIIVVLFLCKKFGGKSKSPSIAYMIQHYMGVVKKL